MNRAIADAEFIQVVDALDERVSPFDLIALADIKHFIHPETLPPNEGARPRNGRFLAGRRPPGDTGLAGPGIRPRFQQRSNMELNLGEFVRTNLADPSAYPNRWERSPIVVNVYGSQN